MEGFHPVVQSSAGNARNLARGFLGVGAASMLGNVFAYVLLVLAARILDARDYSGFIALMNIALVGSIPAFALQVVTARRVATGQAQGLLRLSAGLAAGVGALFVVIAPVEVTFLHLSGITAPILIALSLPGVTILGLCQGVWQGSQRFTALAITTFVAVAARTGAGIIGLLIGRTTTTAVLMLTIGVTAAAVVCVRKLPRDLERSMAHSADPGTPHPNLLLECLHAAHAYGVFLLLSVTDVLLASHVLPTHEAAVYAAGSVMTKAALWLPQAAANVLFADMTDHERHRGLFVRAAGAIIVLGSIVTVFCWLAGDLVAAIVGGNQYPELRGELWLFAILGSSLALLQFALVSGLAIRSKRVSAVIWLTVLAEVFAVLVLGRNDTVHEIISTVCVINLIAVGLALILRSAHRPIRPAPLQLDDSSPGQGPGANSGA